MKALRFFILWSILLIQISIQSPVGSTNLQHSVDAFSKHIGQDPMNMPLRELLQHKPTNKKDVKFAGFEHIFSSHPEIAPLNDKTLNHDEYVTKVMEIRKGIEHDAVARVNLRAALLKQMETQNIDKNIVKSVKGRYDSMNNRQARLRAVRREKQADPIAFNERRKRYELKSREKFRLLEEQGIKELSFEEQMIQHGIPSDADAYTIEEMSREFWYPDPSLASYRLKTYLATRFDPVTVENAIARRGLDLRTVSHRAALKTQREKKRKADLDKVSSSEHRIPAPRSGSSIKTLKDTSTSSILPKVTNVSPVTEIGTKASKLKKPKVDEGQISTSFESDHPSTKSPHSTTSITGSLEDGTQFDDTEWWNDL
jgi:hypothetical protein